MFFGKKQTCEHMAKVYLYKEDNSNPVADNSTNIGTCNQIFEIDVYCEPLLSICDPEL